MQSRMVEFHVRYRSTIYPFTFINREYVYNNATGSHSVPEHAFKSPESHTNGGEQI